MDLRRWFSPIAAAAAITLLGSLTAFAVEGVASNSDADGGDEVVETDAAPLDEVEDLVLELVQDTSSDDVEDDVEDEGEGRPEDAPDNHGQTVSEFARTTDLEGCEKGHAISAVARGADPSDPQNSEQYKPCNDGDDSEEVEDLDSEELEDGDAEAGPGNGHAKARGNGHAKARGNAHGKARGAGHPGRGPNPGR